MSCGDEVRESDETCFSFALSGAEVRGVCVCGDESVDRSTIECAALFSQVTTSHLKSLVHSLSGSCRVARAICIPFTGQRLRGR